ncbi:glycerate dehydrogenase [Aaosphaeria arxii CBS 175.79]|uniref:Glycerate dehydrogenase n=1 Tax=Aaosphaeria arxii CBS 175.79 TaxID=1450172 RepID=A0A6A5X7Y5_9PLEO|nr:glycerate dehydrogenase [Aaosphaeria arxii CBS 175.79]KAF2009009.1 glycerate dehydrogenase [Aaosphaeria arxii CBS 175.79]
MHHHIVAIERVHQPLPDTFDFPHTLTTYHRTDASQLAERLRDATILIVTIVKIPAEVLDPDVTPNLRLIAIMATGTDPVDLVAARARGIRVTNTPAANIDAVSEHALSLYFAARRRTVILDAATRAVPSEWKAKNSLTQRLRFGDGKPPLTCGDEVLGIVGYGGLGKRVATLGRALGMQVLVAARKNATPSASSTATAIDNGNAPSLKNALAPPATAAAPDESRIPFDQVLRRSTVLVLCLPRTPETIDLISAAELAAMSPYSVLINIARGGIVNEAAVVEALKADQIAGYATDVFETEPVEEDSPLLSEEAKALNITLSPHLAWFSQRTLTNLGQILKTTVEAWVKGDPINVIV